MPVPVQNLDDRRFDDLVQEGLRLIPAHAPEWTNHNPTDPGITVLELFAYVTEMLLYQTNRITDHHRQAFLSMLVGSEGAQMAGAILSQNIEEAIRRFNHGERAVTCEDYERLAKAADAGVARAQCVPGFDLTSTIPFKRSNHISVLVIPHSSDRTPLPSADLLRRVSDALEIRRLLATHVHVVAPHYVPITVRLSVMTKGVQSAEQFRQELAKSVRRFLDPVQGGITGIGWPAGHALYVSDLLREIHSLSHVEYVDSKALSLETDPSRMRRSSSGDLISVNLGPGEYFVPEVSPHTIHVTQEM